MESPGIISGGEDVVPEAGSPSVQPRHPGQQHRPRRLAQHVLWVCSWPVNRKRRALIALIACGGILAACALLVIRLGGGPGGTICCLCHLEHIGTMCYLSTGDFGGYLPPSFSAMSKWANTPKIFSCPETRPFPKTLQEVDSLATCIYVAGLRLEDPGSCALAFDHPANHGGRGGNVLFVDGHAEWVEQTALERLVREPWAGQEILCPRAEPLDEMVLEDLKARITVIYQGRVIRADSAVSPPGSGEHGTPGP